ncbi:MAG: ABC transporter ATP-binding protein [Nitriliruptor sp.]|uniref:ABC transporter ATP-binding protein n=1 Tax=Nitriliruptor sp. TaxID=2448056 RepID=UPI0034A09790
MTDIRLEGLTRRYGSVTALDGLTLDIGGGTVTALLGPSGCGKTTALKLVAGLLDPSGGQVLFDGHDVTDVPAERRGAVMVFQDHRLFPYLSAGDNVAFGLKMRGVPRRQRRREAEAVLERVGLDGLADRHPAELSGGQQQRVALARALILQPEVLLLDEPLANLDAHLREGMRELILDVQRERDLTTVVVTHDQEEAVVLSEDIALLFDGRLHQHGAPRTFFEHPATERTARFFGAANLVAGRRHGDRVHTPLGSLRVPDGTPGGPDVWLTVRPERLVVGDTPAADGQHVQGRVVSSAFLGTRTRATVEVAGVRLTVDVADDALADVGPGSLLTLGLPAEALWTVPREATAGPTPRAADELGPVAASADGTVTSPPDRRTQP